MTDLSTTEKLLAELDYLSSSRWVPSHAARAQRAMEVARARTLNERVRAFADE